MLRTSPLSAFFGSALLLVSVFAAFLPLTPNLPLAELDSSWAFGLNQAVAQHLRFGQDILFTFGPYAGIYTELYHPATDSIVLIGAAYLAWIYWRCLLILKFQYQQERYLWLAVVLSSFVVSRDALLFSLVWLIDLALIKRLTTPTRPPFNILTDANLLAALGLLVLVKGSLLGLCGITILSAACVYIGHREFMRAAMCLIAPLISAGLFWIVSGQLIADLPGYLAGLWPISAGYTDAMAVDGNPGDLVAYVLFAFAWLIINLTRDTTPASIRLFLAINAAALFLMVFKAGFVRHDAWHIVTPACFVLVMAVLNRAHTSRRAFSQRGLSIFALLVFVYLDAHAFNQHTSDLWYRLGSRYQSAWHGLQQRFNTPDAWRLDYQSTLNQINAAWPLPKLNGKVDIYSYRQTQLIASGNDWKPRPTFQSYSAYTPSIIAHNRDALTAADAADYLLFSIEPIDRRLPALEDGASWASLFCRYRPLSWENGLLLLQKHQPAPDCTPLRKAVQSVQAFGQPVDLSATTDPTFISLEIKKSLPGALATFFYKLKQLEIKLELANGQVRHYRLIANMASMPLLLSPLIENTQEFLKFYERPAELADKRVVRFEVRPLESTAGYAGWNDPYTIEFFSAR